ncbi:MAG: alpha/beta hydrolase [Spirochaetales bacterium]|uniref:Alpha/beta hydrolase n=1 Tax=Candidatus Thalassospirochaeta sargassi TaxID=3119039 RepID=A0AAJ1IFQ4_9SPIO|nr:alpha/beta hydrolase [Spirochaetales bacterium]
MKRMKKMLPVIMALLISACSSPEINRIDETIYLRYQGADMPAYVHGSLINNTILVVLHGAGSFGLSFRDEGFKSLLEKDYLIVYFDQRGQGMSQGHYSTPDDVVLAMANDVNALIKVLKQRYGNENKYFLMGHSFGGAVGKLALLSNDLQTELAGWISVCGAHDFPSIAAARKMLILDIAQEQITSGNSISKWEELTEELENLDAASDDDYTKILLIAGTAMELLKKDDVVAEVDYSDQLINTIFINNPITWQVSHLFNKPVNIAITEDFSLTGRLSEITLPTLLIYGKYDMSVPYTIGETAIDDLGSTNKRFILFENSMHHPNHSESELFASSLTNFIQEVSE